MATVDQGGLAAVQQDRDRILAELLDRQLISDVMLRFGRGLDLHDWDLYRSTMMPELDVDFFDLTGRPPTRTTNAAFARFAEACLQPLVVQHQYSNFTIDIDSDDANGIFYHVCRHRRLNRHGDDHYTQYGWYENSFHRTENGWKISQLTHKFQWCDGNPGLIDLTTPEFGAAATEIWGGGA